MEKKFTIHFSIRTIAGLVTFGRFEVGTDEHTALKLFDNLLGNADIGQKDVLLVELFEWQKQLPLNIRIKSCTLEEMGYNCKLITKDIFRARLLKEDKIS